MMHSLSSSVEQWSRDLTRLPDHALSQLQRERILHSLKLSLLNKKDVWTTGSVASFDCDV